MKGALQRWGLTPRNLKMMFKGALPSTIATAMYQSPAVASVYGNFGFLITVASILSLHLLPRARFIQNVALATFLTGCSAAVILLAHFVGLKAREHTTPSGDSLHGYNASASVFVAIFLCFVVWLVSSLRAAYPQYTIPFLICTILSMVGLSFGPEVYSQSNSLALVKQLLLSYLTGFGLSAAVGLLVFPRTCRSVFLEGSQNYLSLCQNLLRAQSELFESSMSPTESPERKERNLKTVQISSSLAISTVSQLTEELTFAKMELAFGNNSKLYLDGLMLSLQALLIPLLGLSKIGAFDHLNSDPRPEMTKLSKLSSCSFGRAKSDLRQASEQLEVLLTPKKSFGGWSNPPSRTTQNTLKPDTTTEDRKSSPDRQSKNTFEGYRSITLQGLILPIKDEKAVTTQDDENDGHVGAQNPMRMLHQHLYLQNLLNAISRATEDLERFTSTGGGTSSISQDTTPVSSHRFWKLLHQRVFPNTGRDENKAHSDPEHLPPATAFEKIGDFLRSMFRSITSDSSSFGFRVVFATMSIGILGFLKQTQQFFITYRLVWAMVMIPISMSPTSGNAIYGFVGRAFGVALAMVLAYINWYIVDGHATGVIVFFFLCMMLYYYFLLRFPRYIVIFILAAVNHVLIIGYELQVGVNGVKKATVSGQRYFALHTLAPYRLFCVLAGLFVALFWTIFPVQISEHGILRNKVSRSLSLLSEYCGSVSVTLEQRMNRTEGDLQLPTSAGRKSKAARYAILFEELSLLAEMRVHSEMTRYEFSVGGKFPKYEYDRIINGVQE
ncbi:hypothetical protein EJ08DRAFT_723189 [Tothia fuscella]|uniref:ER transporter 6TM N-terminal domain-containing protein n=1 Tax=Tothia fuscella TaxID=1048955 RepID=A0A9P4TVG3_9PEZI|nr:hypothetical protein EJ08DRAFT_723189 [Tothia fuscella]